MKSFVLFLVAVCLSVPSFAQSRNRDGGVTVGSGVTCWYRDGRSVLAINGSGFKDYVYHKTQSVASADPSYCATARVEGWDDSGVAYGKFGSNRVYKKMDGAKAWQIEGYFPECQHFVCHATQNF